MEPHAPAQNAREDQIVASQQVNADPRDLPARWLTSAPEVQAAPSLRVTGLRRVRRSWRMSLRLCVGCIKIRSEQSASPSGRM
jgi:hypothetical protein